MSIFYKKLKKIGMLDQIRLNKGTDKMKENFSDLINNNPEKAIKLINDKNVQFTSLFILQPRIKRSELFNHLSERNKHALEITNGILLKEFLNSQRFSSDDKKEDYSTLKWILETGYIGDGLSDQYDEVLDTAAIILSKVYKDKNYLPTIEEMIFNRYRRGAFIYDLVWTFFEVSDADNLIMVANRLRSTNQKDVELARKFLNFIPCIGMDNEKDNMKLFQCALKWIKLNKDFLYYTGETYLQTSNPFRYAVSLEAKYLQKPAQDVNGEIYRSLTDDECSCLDSFKKLDDDSKLRISNYSSMLYHQSKYRWSKWLQNPVDQQLAIAKILGDHND